MDKFQAGDKLTLYYRPKYTVELYRSVFSKRVSKLSQDRLKELQTEFSEEVKTVGWVQNICPSGDSIWVELYLEGPLFLSAGKCSGSCSILLTPDLQCSHFQSLQIDIDRPQWIPITPDNFQAASKVLLIYELDLSTAFNRPQPVECCSSPCGVPMMTLQGSVSVQNSFFPVLSTTENSIVLQGMFEITYSVKIIHDQVKLFFDFQSEDWKCTT
jgi:hypothetical protein